MVPVAHLPTKAGAATPTHEAISSEIGYFQSGHLSGDLPELRSKENDCPGELEGGPGGDRNEEGVVGTDGAEIDRQWARG